MHESIEVNLLCIITQQICVCIQEGYTALHVACQDGHDDTVKVLMRAKADLNLQTNVSNHFSDCLLSRSKAWVNHVLYTVLITMLRYTARGVQVHCVMMCDLTTLDSGTLYDSQWLHVYCHVTVNLQEGVTALHSASEDGHVTTVQLLLESGTSLDVQANVNCYLDTTHKRL